MSELRWKRAEAEELPAIGAYLRSRECEAAGCIGRMLRGSGEERVLRLPQPLRGSCHVAVEGKKVHGESRPILGLIYRSPTGVVFPLLPPGAEIRSDPGIPRGLGDSLASIVGPESDVERFERAIMMKPIVAVTYDLMARRPAPLGEVPASTPPGFATSAARLEDLEELFPLQEAYEREEVITAIHRFDAGGCRAGLLKALKEQVVLIGRFEGAAVAKAATNARAFSLDQLGGIFVAPPYRRRGMGRAIVSELVGRLAREGRGAALFVKRSNEAARSLYEELGFGTMGPFRADYFIG